MTWRYMHYRRPLHEDSRLPMILKVYRTSLCSSGKSWNSVGFRNAFTLVSRSSRYRMGMIAARATTTLIHPGMPESC